MRLLLRLGADNDIKYSPVWDMGATKQGYLYVEQWILVKQPQILQICVNTIIIIQVMELINRKCPVDIFEISV